MAYILNKSYEEIVFNLENIKLTPTQYNEFKNVIQRRNRQEPLAKIRGYKEFWGLNFQTTQDTLDPRPESETLIEAVLKNYPDLSFPYKILDLGTGTGCLLLSLLYQYPHATGVGVDISGKALKIAKSNAEVLTLINRTSFVKGDWTSGLCSTFDVIVSNPPYISNEDKIDLQTQYDPSIALFAKEKGLFCYKLFSSQLQKFLKKDGCVFLEVGHTQGETVKNLFTKQGWVLKGFYKDLLGWERCLFLGLK